MKNKIVLKSTPRQKLETWLSENYSIRYNTVKFSVEFSPIVKNQKPEYQSITDRDMFSMLRRIDQETDLKVNERLLFQVLNSDFAPRFNPIESYFNGLYYSPDQMKKSEIDHMADFCILKNPKDNDKFKRVLRSWLVSSVANSLTPTGCQNQTILTLVGNQGKGKTTYLNSFCPPDLLEYLYTSNIDLKNKDTFISLGQNFIMNIDDQLENLYKQDSETLKTFATQREKKIRLPHARFVQNIPRLANLLASLNLKEFLRDQSGNRRVLPFEVKGFILPDEKNNYDINKVWFEAYQEFLTHKKNKTAYWLTKEQLEEIFGGFEEFYMVTPEEEVLTSLFEIPTSKSQLNSNFKKLMLIEIEKEIINSKAAQRINTRLLGQILKKLGCEETTRHPGKRCFWIRRKDHFEIEREQSFDENEIPELREAKF
jgi:predicted P-loop ATPase